MTLLASLRSVVSTLLHRSRVEVEMDEELRSHIQNRADDLERSGLPRAEAERRARVEFGGYQRFKEECREEAGTHWFESLLQDAGFGLRMLRKSPVFTAVATLTLALGIGANTAIFSVVYAALLRPLPYAQPDRLITLAQVRGESDSRFWDASYPDYLDWTRQSKTFQALAGFAGDGFVLKGQGEPQLLIAAQATPNFFSTLGVKPFLGRDFAAGEDVASGPNVAILSYAFWKRQFGGDEGVLGRSMQLDEHSVRIVGVLPREFEFAPRGSAELWVPMHISGGRVTRRNLRWMPVVGRLAPGVKLPQAVAEMKTITANLAAAYPQENGSVRVLSVPLRDRIVGKVQTLLLIVFGAVGFVLLIACANVANLLMVRAAGRRKEFAIRTAIGASRGRLISQMLAESLILAACGGALGYFLAQWGTSLLIAGIPKAQLNAMPFLRDAHANPAVLGFLCAAAVATGLVFGLAPALQVSRERAADTLKEESRSSAGGRRRLRDALVVIEIAFSMVLLVGAGLMVESLSALMRRNPGFDTRNLLTFSVNLPSTAYPKDEDAIRFDGVFSARMQSLPGVVGTASNSVVPLTGGGNTIRFLVEGQPRAVGQENECNIRDVSANYFHVMKIPLAAGRFFDDSEERATGPNRVIVNQAWLKQFLPGEAPIGKRVRFTNSPTQPYREIVGVVGNIADAGLDSPEEPAIYLPFLQDASTFINYIVRTNGNPAGMLSAVRTALRETDAQLFPVFPFTMDQIIDQSPSVFLRRYPSYLIGSFALLALVLAMIGLYGLVSYSVSQRAREMGIRLALGASRSDVLRLVLGEGARLAAIGIAIGAAAALALTRLMSSLLFGVSAMDALTFGAVGVLLGIVALAACSVPARRAMRTDPVVALRWE
jgi:putative ABC transport system permease protein